MDPEEINQNINEALLPPPDAQLDDQLLPARQPGGFDGFIPRKDILYLMKEKALVIRGDIDKIYLKLKIKIIVCLAFLAVAFYEFQSYFKIEM